MISGKQGESRYVCPSTSQSQTEWLDQCQGLMPRLMPYNYAFFSFFLTLDIVATHFIGLPPFSNFEISRIFSLPLPRCYK
jgi:hypothetical protein